MAAVRFALGRPGLIHFACHAEADTTDPARSGLVLADRTLTGGAVRGAVRPAMAPIMREIEHVRAELAALDEADAAQAGSGDAVAAWDEAVTHDIGQQRRLRAVGLRQVDGMPHEPGQLTGGKGDRQRARLTPTFNGRGR